MPAVLDPLRRRLGRWARWQLRRGLQVLLRPLIDRPRLTRVVRAAARPAGLDLFVLDLLPPGAPAGEVLLPATPALSEDIRTPSGRRRQSLAGTKFPDVGYRVLEDAVVTPRCSGALTRDAVFRRQPVNGEDLILHPGAVPGLRADRGGAVVTASRRAIPLDAAIFLGGMWSYNYYHWMTEYLPLLWLADRLPAALRTLPVLVDATALDLPAARATLDLMRDGRTVISGSPRHAYRVGRLVVLDAMKLVEATIGGGWVTEYHGEALHADGMRAFRTDLMRRLDLGPRLAGSGPRVVAIRPEGASRPDNQTEVVARLAPLGFTAVDPGRLTVRDQARLFRDASVVCGPAGAAMTNLMFAEHPARAVVWGDPGLDLQRGWWPNLAALGGATTTMLPVDPDPGRPEVGRVDPEQVVGAIGPLSASASQ